MKRVLLAIAPSVFCATLVAQPRPAMLGAPTHARAAMQPVAVSTTSVTLLLTLTVDDGWHVSWRNPGETGLPTRFAWNLPHGVRVRREMWPVPTVTRSDVGVAHTLEGEVPWLVEFVVDAPATADRLISLTMRYGICRDVCIPEQMTVQGVLPAAHAGAATLGAVPALLRGRLAADASRVPARVNENHELCLDHRPKGVAASGLDIIAGPDRGFDAAVAVPAHVAAARGPLRVTLPAAARLREPTDTVLLVSGARGVTVPLDFRAPAPHCGRRSR